MRFTSALHVLSNVLAPPSASNLTERLATENVFISQESDLLSLNVLPVIREVCEQHSTNKILLLREVLPSLLKFISVRNCSARTLRCMTEIFVLTANAVNM
jgi:hypothetical protein